VGCPIRTSEAHRALAPPLGFSQRATSFIASRYQGIHQMPFSCCGRAQPRARAAGSSSPQGGSPQTRAGRGQRSEVRRRRLRPSGRRFVSDLRSPISDLRDRGAHGSPGRCASHRPHAYPCSRPDLIPCGHDGRTCFTVTTRFTISREHRTEDKTTDQVGPTRPFPVTTRGSRRQKTHSETLSVL
jgi:hypothetical protein